MTSEARILPLEPPFDPETEESLARWMPPGSPVPPLALFRTLARHPMLRDRMRPLGAGLLARGVLPPRARELLVLRTTARCGATYEWGVHARATQWCRDRHEELVAWLDREEDAEAALDAEDDALLLRAADELHDGAALSDATFAAVHSRFADEGVLEIAAVVGFYHLISFVLGAARLPDEPWTVAFPR